jgi:lysozyme
MRISKNGIDLIKRFEGYKSKPYLDSGGIPTIGYGNTYYPDGKKVRLNDPSINESTADILLIDMVRKFESVVESSITSRINQNQFDALVSFSYNIGGSNFRKSTLLRKVNINPNDKTIKDEFQRWNKSNGKVLPGLIRRRDAEWNLFIRK